MAETKAVAIEEKFKTESLRYLEQSKNIVITTAEQLAVVDTERKAIKSFIKNVDDFRLSLTRPYDEAKANVIAKFAPFTDTAKQAAANYETAQRVYINEQERIRREAQAKAEAEARAAEEKRRAELAKQEAAQREKERLLREAAEKEADEKRKAELQAQADKAAARADARATCRENVFIPAAQVAAPEIRVDKRTFGEKWEFVVDDQAALPEMYKLPDMKLLNKTAQMHKGKIEIPGGHCQRIG